MPTEIEILQNELKTLQESFKSLSEGLKKEPDPKPEPKPEDDLLKKTEDKKTNEDKNLKQSKEIEEAIKFSVSKDSFLKTYSSFLPKDVATIFEIADKENYNSELEKVASIKSAIIQKFYSIQSNLDFLMPNQKNDVLDYLKLTKDAKEEGAASIFKAIFEPNVEMMLRIKKAQEAAKANGSHDLSDAESEYIKKIKEHSEKYYLGGL